MLGRRPALQCKCAATRRYELLQRKEPGRLIGLSLSIGYAANAKHNNTIQSDISFVLSTSSVVHLCLIIFVNKRISCATQCYDSVIDQVS